ncbi:RagB/SusD family nutrient uptake outer membrane protein [Mangrovibacterium marinum]|uniref:SusD-like starch-binding protein associating with outer membrane n=1 Tax=Mangrovibacterium marinum TaxID=1639118 RepID=A0A2T5BXS7_9BACT|nr:RagB/SusD family nutrient uptake outer membrane protein [Mangrovibacterium marinum]PTN05928.1 SusD-like starch-binding protein associating with outer membrane [Mangrovibacterium marinum]
MKRFSILKITGKLFAGSVLALSMASCSDYFDVSPKSQILTDEHFSRESGFYDQLTGVYSEMATGALYGREMTFGLAEVLSQNYDMDATNTYRYAAQYDYENSGVKSRINNVWSTAYNCIANLNVMLEYYNTVDSTIFTANHYNLYRGEALGLRAFLHFELLKAFSPSPASNAQALAVPYVTAYDPSITPQKTVDETMDLIIADLEDAVSYLQTDSLRIGDSPYSFSEERHYFFNYYAAKQTLARAYLWKGDLTNAAEVAEEVITDYEDGNSSPAGWVHFTQVQGPPNDQVNRLYTPELVFRLNIPDMLDYVDAYFTEEAGANSFYFTEESLDKIFEKSSKGLGNDFRSLFGFQYDGENQYLWKYHQYDDFKDMMPVIRKSEIYYIAAEAEKETNPARAVELLNEVRSYRNISTDNELPESLTATEIQEEIFKEYRKEFLGEGQLFFYYKRLNIGTIEGSSVAANNAVYVWPMPDNEVEFGNR